MGADKKRKRRTDEKPIREELLDELELPDQAGISLSRCKTLHSMPMATVPRISCCFSAIRRRKRGNDAGLDAAGRDFAMAVPDLHVCRRDKLPRDPEPLDDCVARRCAEPLAHCS